MAFFFTDFLSADQIRHWPSTTYKPQQNAPAERMWGTRFGMARALLKFANLGPAFHPFAVQSANWICNRLPQSSRANMSPWFILSRHLASIGYLKSFGCLVRMTIPLARREGDRHFADRGTLGVYLGPSEQSPGAVVYAPSLKKFFVTRDIICYEDVHPGVKHVDSAWAELDDRSPGVPLLGDPATPQTHTPPPRLLPGPTETPALRESIEAPFVPDARVEDHGGAADHLGDLQPSGAAPVTADQAPVTAPADEKSAAVEMHASFDEVGTNPQHDQANNPSSKYFKRILPQRATRYKGAYSVADEFVDPMVATREQAIRNLAHLTGDALESRGDLLVYEAPMGGVGRVFVVTNTSELGKVQIPKGFRHAMSLPQAKYWMEAITKEYNGLLALGTFEFVPRATLPAYANVMRCHLVFDLKRNSDGSIDKFKARLVADGNTQRHGIDFDRIFSTVAKLSTLRILFVLAAARDYNLTSIDIRQAYLQASLTEELYMNVPPGMNDADENGNPLVVRLRRSLYGLKQAGREWHTLLTETLREFGFHQSTIDVCLFTYRRQSAVLLIVVWVDDCVIADNDPSLRDEFVGWLGKRFPVEDKSELQWILHVQVSRDRNDRSLTLSQRLYVRDLLERYEYLLEGLTRRFDSPHDATAVLSPDQCPAADSSEHLHMQRHRSDYMSLVGAFLWLANVSRPELTYISSQLARFVSNPAMVHYKAALRVLVYLRGTLDQSLQYTPASESPLRAFVDSDWATRFSVSGGIIEFMGCPIHWLSRSQRSVSMSSTEAEYFACCLLAREILYFRDLLADLGCMQTGPTILLTDNKGVVALSFDPVSFRKTKHILRAAEFVRDLVTRHVLVLKWIPGASNVADLCTKSVALPVFRTLMSLLRRLCDVA